MSHHHTIGEAGQCPECRAETIAEVGDAPHGFALFFKAQVAFVRSWDPTIGGAVETAWATGCNAGGQVIVRGPFPAEILERAGVRLFELIDDPADVAAVDAVGAAYADYGRARRK
jgi:hypothetical protein